MLAVGAAPDETLETFAATVGLPPPRMPVRKPGADEVVAWFRTSSDSTETVHVVPARGDRQRHRRKYAEGDVGPEKSFYFRGPEGKLKLRAQNLVLFAQMAEGVDDETWLHHLHQHDYSRWFREAIKDDGLAEEAERIERLDGTSADETREQVIAAIEERYGRPA